MSTRSVAVVFVVILATQSVATTTVVFPTRETLARVWLAGPTEGFTSARLDLDRTGKGTLILCVGAESPTQAYRVTAVQIKEFQVRMTLAPIDRGADVLAAEGKATSRLLELELKCTAGAMKGSSWHLKFASYDAVIASVKAVDDRAVSLKRHE
jgi:hypothetical protein